MHFGTVSTHISLRSMPKLTMAETLRYFLNFLCVKDNPTP